MQPVHVHPAFISLCSPARSRRQFSFLKRGPRLFLVSTCLLQPPFIYRPTRSIQGIPSYHGSLSPPNTASSFSSQTHYLRTLCHDTPLQSLYSYPPSLLFPSLNHEPLPVSLLHPFFRPRTSCPPPLAHTCSILHVYYHPLCPAVAQRLPQIAHPCHECHPRVMSRSSNPSSNLLILF